MNEEKIDVALLQETWLVSNFTKVINGFRFIHHGLESHKSNRGERGVAIILSPSMSEAH